MGDNALLKDYIPHELGIRGGLGGGGELPDFHAPLKTSLILSRGSGLPTHTRATSATFTDFEGLVKTVPAGCARFGGARFVHNTCGIPSESPTLDGLGLANIFPTNPSMVAFGYTLAKATLIGGLVGHYLYWEQSTGGAGWNSVYVDVTNLATKYLYEEKSGAQFTWTGPTTITTNAAGAYKILGPYQAILFSKLASSNNCSFYIGAYGDYSGDGEYVYISRMMAEKTEGQANQNPSEYVSVGVLSYPYHGAGADGCKFFATQNGNTVASNVVTEAAGAAIPAATLRKYFHEGEARTNLCLQSEAFDDAAWTKRGTCTVTPNALVSPDGKMTMDLIENLQLPVVGDIYQNFGVASGVRYEPSVYMQRVSTSGTLYLENASDGALGQWAIDLSLLGSGTERITRHHPAVTINTEFTGSAGGGGGMLLRSAGGLPKSVYLFGSQGEVGTSSSSYIPTTTAAVTRNADVLTYPVAGNMRDLAGACYAEYSSNDFTNGQWVLGDGAGLNRPVFYINSNQQTNSYDGTSILSGPIVPAVPVDTVRKVAVRWNASVRRVFEGGLAGTEGAYDGSWDFTSIGIGGPSTGLNGHLGEVKMWLNPPSDTKLQAMTA